MLPVLNRWGQQLVWSCRSPPGLCSVLSPCSSQGLCLWHLLLTPKKPHYPGNISQPQDSVQRMAGRELQESLQLTKITFLLACALPGEITIVFYVYKTCSLISRE